MKNLYQLASGSDEVDRHYQQFGTDFVTFFH